VTGLGGLGSGGGDPVATMVMEMAFPVLKPIVEAKLPSFSMLGSTEVRHGALMSIAQADFSYVGLFHAETIARIFNGATSVSASDTDPSAR
jgi:hypothetical protein